VTAETLQGAYDRGLLDGKIVTRLDHHDDRLAASDRLLARTIDITATLTSTVQTLTEARVTDAATRLATAQAVKEAKDLTESQSHEGWSPVAKLATAVGILAVIWAILSSLPFSI